MRYADPQQGRVLIGGSDIRALTQQELMRQISVVFQDVYLFDDTIGNNIRRPRRALPRLHHGNAAGLPNPRRRYRRQTFRRRTPAHHHRPRHPAKPSVLILDEATAFANAENEALLMRALAALMQDKTVLMIAHRLATIRHAAQILVFDHGQLVEQGDHASLIAQNGRYARLWQAGEAARHWRIGSAEQ